MSGLNEADTCRVYITPALKTAGWGDPHWRIAEQYYFTDGQIYLVGDGHRRRKGKKADYLLRHTESFPIAMVEAKMEDFELGTGLQQLKDHTPQRTVPVTIVWTSCLEVPTLIKPEVSLNMFIAMSRSLSDLGIMNGILKGNPKQQWKGKG